MVDGFKILHAQKFQADGSLYNILLEVEFTDIKLIPLHGKSTYIWIYYDYIQRIYYIKSMFNADGYMKDERKNLGWPTMKHILDFIRDNPNDTVILPVIHFKGQKPPGEKKAGFFDKIKAIFKKEGG